MAQSTNGVKIENPESKLFLGSSSMLGGSPSRIETDHALAFDMEQVKVTNTINKQKRDHLSKLVFSAEDEFNNVRNMLSKAKMDQCSMLISQDKVLEEMASHD